MPWTGVGDGHPDPGGLLEGAAGHRPSRDVVADGIVDQVDQRPLDLLPVRLDGQSTVEIGLQGEPALVQQHLEFVENRAQERVQAEGRPLQALGQLQPGEIEQVLDQLLHARQGAFLGEQPFLDINGQALVLQAFPPGKA